MYTVKLFIYFVLIIALINRAYAWSQSGKNPITNDKSVDSENGDNLYDKSLKNSKYHDKCPVDIDDNVIDVAASSIGERLKDRHLKNDENNIHEICIVEDICFPGDYMLENFYKKQNNVKDKLKKWSEIQDYDDEDVVVTEDYDNYFDINDELSNGNDVNLDMNTGKEIVKYASFPENLDCEFCKASNSQNTSLDNYKPMPSIEDTPQTYNHDKREKTFVSYGPRRERKGLKNEINKKETSFLSDCVVPEIIPHSISEATGIKQFFSDVEDEIENKVDKEIMRKVILDQEKYDKHANKGHGDNSETYSLKKYYKAAADNMAQTVVQPELREDGSALELIISSNIAIENKMSDLHNDVKSIKFLLEKKLGYKN